MTIPCIHHYNCESPTGLTSRGVCRHCGAERMFQNFVGQEKDDIAPQVKAKRREDLKHPARRQSLEPKPCDICGNVFVPSQTRQVLCGDKDCKRAAAKLQHLESDARRKADHEAAGKGG